MFSWRVSYEKAMTHCKSLGGYLALPSTNQVEWGKTKTPKTGEWSLDRMTLDQTTRSKVFVKFGTRLNLFFGSRLKVFINFGTRSKVLLMF